MSDYQFSYHTSIHDFAESDWQKLADGQGPFVQFPFLAALEDSKSVGGNIASHSGWLPRHIAVRCNDEIQAIVPGYLKTHSYGEYVFDHSWANAYARYGLEYYPKWISAIPFTPVTGARVLGKVTEIPNWQQQLEATINDEGLCASTHWLFCPKHLQSSLAQKDYLSRYSVQFQWYNNDFVHFDDYLAQFTSRKRKDIRKERNKATQHVEIVRATGDEITAEMQHAFYLCYQETYLKRSGHNGYLTKAFFEQIFSTFQDAIMLVMARSDGNYVAGSLFFYDQSGLYGRYWGAIEEADGLHFECCYYQGIEFAIERQLPLFNPGTQGEHKILRGFEPTFCHSSHKLMDPRFHQAIADFLDREKPAIEEYYQQAVSMLPFNEQTLMEKGLNNIDTTKLV